MRTFEFKDGKSNKFWNIEREGKSFTVTYGRIGTDGQAQTKDFLSEDKAQAAHDKLVAEKVGKGYVETTSGTVAATPSSGKVLENAIFANPDDLGAHAAYADWLIEQGDPRGEFIQVQLVLEDEKKSAKERKELEKREKELLKKHEREWLGELAPHFLDQEVADWQRKRDHINRFQFARGWLETIRIVGLNVAGSRALAKRRRPAWYGGWRLSPLLMRKQANTKKETRSRKVRTIRPSIHSSSRTGSPTFAFSSWASLTTTAT